MFKKILVANRGEIALRIIRAARELNIATVAVYSTADSESLHVKFADESVCIGPPQPSKSYLSVPSIISAAEVTSADAIHPGYGFLSENASFAEICAQCGFAFIGPRAEAIKLMGDKMAARKAMTKAGMKILPGTNEPITSEKEAIAIAKDVGFPLIIKASAGGGGRGMKIVRKKEDLAQQIGIARTEAKAAFGNDAIYIERYVERPRHIEFQIAADNYGEILHLGERECSVQRRHQKLIEESPSPALTPEKRGEVGKQIVDSLKAIGYTTVGTVEMLMDETGELHFMEMNTRIQVEHPVTELVTGIDLVRLQIALAAGRRLPFSQSDVKLQGHAIECRVNAEDPFTFDPSPGQITAYYAPGGPGVRVDSHVTQDTIVQPFYDSLLAKLIVHDIDRSYAIRRMKSALKEFVVEGVKTNIAFHRRVMDNTAFVSGEYDTNIANRVVGEAQ
jgi:acetyl-CoA carboxylase, biotin carboxylase subunit